MKPAHSLIIVLLFFWRLASAQANDAKSPENQKGSVVTGHVYFDDTKAPARKAQVYLEPIAALSTDAPPNRSASAAPGPITASMEIQFDGSYMFTHVAPGSYYVIATCPGYISPFIQLQLAEDRSPHQEWKPLGPEDKKARDRVLRSIARVDVQSNLPASADVVLERGAAVSGNVSYDDGGPATGLRLKLLARMDQNGKQVWTPIQRDSSFLGLADRSTTDDRGNYRISGLPPGNYMVEADLEFQNTVDYRSSSGGGIYSSGAHSAFLPIYSGSTPHLKEAADFTLQQREERTGEDIVIPVSKIHTVKGTIVSARDGHLVNGGGVELLNASDRSLAAQQALTEDDPSFTFSFVFEGDYILTSAMSFDADYVPVSRNGTDPGPPQFESHPLRVYGSASMPLHVDGDMDRLTLAVPEPTPKQEQLFHDLIRQQEQQQPPTPSTDTQ